MRRSLLVPILSLSLLTACRSATPPVGNAVSAQKTDLETFKVRGKVVSTDGASVTLDHDRIPGFMEAMTMPYRLKDPGISGELHPGDLIRADLLAHKDRDGGFGDVLLDHVVVIGQARPDYKPAVQYHVPQAGDAVPDFHLLNQGGRTIHLSDFRGKLLLVTFIYTRCNLSDFCPRMSRNFAEIDGALKADPSLYAKTHLLSISFDPAYDTPAVLRTYGGSYTGQFARETFRHWDFAAPPEAELPAVTQFFNVGVTPGDNRSLNHSLSTVLIGRDGKVIAWYPTNDWQPADLLRSIQNAAG